ncbi:MAG: beta strand repeat-containing protein, partial [Flexibacteraceae bacterium]
GDVIRVANGTYASAVTVNKRVSIIGESNNLTSGTIITNLVNVIATGGSASNRVVLDNLCIRYLIGGDANTSNIIVRVSYVTIQNCTISHAGLSPFVATTAGPGAGIRFYRLASEGILRDFVIRNNQFAYQAAGIIVSENVSINWGTNDQFLIEGNDFNEHTSNVIYFMEITSDVSADSGKVENVTIKNNNLRNNRQTTSALGSSIPINLFKGSQDLTIENVGVYSIQRAANSLHQVQVRPQFQGSTTNFNVKDLRMVRSSLEASASNFCVGLYIQPMNTTSTYGTASLYSSISNCTIDGLYSRNLFAGVLADYYFENAINLKNSSATRATHTSVPYQLVPSATTNATKFGCPALSHTFDNNYTGAASAVRAYRQQVSYTNGSPTLTVNDAGCSRNNDLTNSLSGLHALLNGATLIAGLSTVSSFNNTTFTLSGNVTSATNANANVIFANALDASNIGYMTNVFESATINNHQANPINVTTSADAVVGSFTTPALAIAGASAGNKIRGFIHNTTYSGIAVDKNLTFVIHGADRFDSPSKILFENLTVNSGQTLTLKGDMWTTGTLTISGVLDLNGYALVVNGSIAGSGTIKGGSGSVVIYNGSGASDLKMESGFQNLDVLQIGGAGNLTLTTPLTVNQQLRFTSTGNLVIGTNTLTLSGSGVTASSTGGVTYSSTSNLAINSKNPIILPAAVTQLASLSIDGGADVIGGASLSIGTLTVTNGNYTIGAGNTLTVTGTAAYTAGTITGTTTSNMVVNTTGTSAIAPISGGLQDLTLNASGGTVTFNGDVTIHRDYTHTAGSASYPARFRVNRNISYTAGTLIGGAATSLVFEGTPTVTNTLPEIAPFVKSFELNRASGNFNLGGTLRVTDSLRLTAGVLTLNGNTLRFSGNQVSGAGTITADAAATIYLAPTGAGLFSLPFTGGTASLDSVDVNLANNADQQTISTALTVNTLSLSRGLLNLGNNIAVNTAAVVSANADIDFGNFVVSGTGSFTTSSGSTLIIGSADGISASGATGNVQVSGTRTFNAGSIYYYNGGSAQVTGNGLPSSIAELVVDNASNVTLSSDVNVTSLITFNAGRLNLSSSRLSYSSNSATDLNLAGGSSAKLSLLGSTGNVNLNFLASAELNDLVINRSGNPTINLNDPLIINGTLALTNGVLTTSTANELTLADGATYTGGSNSSFVSGPMRKTGNDAFVFPTGKAARYSQIAISAPATITSQFEAEYFASNSTITPDNLDMGTGLFSVSGKEYWNLNRTVGADAVSVTLHWNANDLTIKSTLSDLRVAHYDGNEWNSEGGSTTGTITVGTVTSAAPVSSFSPFTIGSENGDNPLPVTLTKFTGRNVNGQANLFWTTAAELNNSGFEIMKSTDGKNWSVIGFVKGVGTSNKVNNYAFTDANLVYNSFYKLRQVDFDGKTTD